MTLNLNDSIAMLRVCSPERGLTMVSATVTMATGPVHIAESSVVNRLWAIVLPGRRINLTGSSVRI